MIKEFLKMAIKNLVNRWLYGSPAPREHSVSPIHLNTDEVKKLAIRIGSLTTLVFLNFLLFVGAIIVTAVGFAHSFDVHDKFVSNGVFWSGIIMGVTALVIGGLCGWALLHTKVEAKELIYTEPTIEPVNLRDRLFMPFFEGLIEGFRRPSTTEPFDRSRAA